MAVSKTFGPVIATRRLTTAGVRPKTVTVTLGKPRLPKGERDWECPFRISGGGIRVLEHAYGVDSMQAVANALQGIRFYLDESGKSFEWLRMPLETGFQRFIPWYGDTRFTRKLEKLVDSEVKREGVRLRRRHQERQKRKKSSARSG
jgi:hypothetical protein